MWVVLKEKKTPFLHIFHNLFGRLVVSSGVLALQRRGSRSCPRRLSRLCSRPRGTGLVLVIDRPVCLDLVLAFRHCRGPSRFPRHLSLLLYLKCRVAFVYDRVGQPVSV